MRPSVISNADVRVTLGRLLEPGTLPEIGPGRSSVQVPRLVGQGQLRPRPIADLHLPPSDANPNDVYRGMVSISPSVDYLERAYDDAVAGRFSREPYVDMGFPSAVDPSVAPPGKHVMACFVQYAPYELAEGTWDDQREAFGDTVQATITKYAPDFPDAILHRQVLTPLDIERTFGLSEGNIMQGELLLEQLFAERPGVGSGYRTPVRDLYLCGATTHPGGVITGAPGRNAAIAVLRSRRGRGLGRPTRSRRLDASLGCLRRGRDRRRPQRAGLRRVPGSRGFACPGSRGARERWRDGRDVGAVAGCPCAGPRAHGGQVPAPDRARAAVARPRPAARAAGRPAVRAPGRWAGLVLWGNAAQTANALATNDLVGPADAARYVDADKKLHALGQALSQIHGRVPLDLASPTLADALGGLRTAVAAGSRSRGSGLGLLQAMPMAVRDLVAEWFDSDALQAVLAARAMLLSGLGPRNPGSAGVLLTDVAGNDGGLAGQTVFARGGPGALTAALAAAARSFGAEVRTGAPLPMCGAIGEAVVGVTLRSGETIDAPTVVSSLDPKTTFLDLLDPEAIGPRLSWRASNIRQRGATAKVNFALRALPRFPAAESDARLLRGRIVLAPSMAALDEIARAAKYGEVADEPLIEATIPTLADPSLVDEARAGAIKHVLSAVIQGVPFGATADVGEIVTRTIERYAPGFVDLVESRHVITPDDIERDYGSKGGHAMHAEVDLSQWFEWRPLHGYGRYRMPLNGMYLAGSGAAPGRRRDRRTRLPGRARGIGRRARVAAVELDRDLPQLLGRERRRVQVLQ